MDAGPVIRGCPSEEAEQRLGRACHDLGPGPEEPLAPQSLRLHAARPSYRSTGRGVQVGVREQRFRRSIDEMPLRERASRTIGKQNGRDSRQMEEVALFLCVTLRPR